MTLKTKHENIQIYCSDGFSEVPYNRSKIYRLTEDVVDLFFNDVYTEVVCTHRLKRFLTKHRLMGLSLDFIKNIYVYRDHFTDYIPELHELSQLVNLLKTAGDLYLMQTPKQSVIYRVGEVLYFKDDLLIKRKYPTWSNSILKEYSYKHNKLVSSITKIKMGSLDWTELSKRYYSYNVLDKCTNEVYNVMYVEVKFIDNDSCAYYFKDNKLLQVKSFDYKKVFDEFGNECINFSLQWDDDNTFNESHYINYRIQNTYNCGNELIKKEYTDFKSGIKETVVYIYKDSNLYEIKHYFGKNLMLYCVYFHLYNKGILEKIMVEDRIGQNNFYTLMNAIIQN